MLGDVRYTPAIAASDMERAKKFYTDTLGLKLKKEWDEGVIFEAGEGSAFMLYESSFAGTNRATTGTFGVDDVKGMMEKLRAKGVEFEDYDLPGMKTENGLMSDEKYGQAAWFKDSEGNILCISDMKDSD